MFYTTKALVLRDTLYKDNDKLLTLLTEDKGRITVKARGVRRKNSPLRSGCQLLCYSEFTLYESKGFYTVNEVEPVQMFTGLRTDIELLALGSYFCQVLETVSAENVAEPELLTLCLNCLYALDQLKKDQHLVKAAFELRTLSIIGFKPDLRACNICGNENAGEFWLREGLLLCSSCSKIYGRGTVRNVSPPVLHAMRYIIECPHQKIVAFKLPEKQISELSEICEAFLLEQLEQGFSSLTFYKRLFINNGDGT